MQAVSDEESVTLEQNLADVHEKSAPPAVRQLTRKELFDELYMQTFGMKKRERWSYMRELWTWLRWGDFSLR